MAFYANRTSYPIYDFAFSGIPEYANQGDVSPDSEITFRVTVQENNLTNLRSYLQDPQGFAAEITHKDYTCDFQFAHLIEPLSERDYSANQKLTMVFKVRRDYIRTILRPMGQTPVSHADVWHRQLHVYSQDLDRLRRRRIELASAFQELERHQHALTADEEALASRKSALWAAGTDELRAAAEARGF
jgi:hypothetical protein